MCSRLPLQIGKRQRDINRQTAGFSEFDGLGNFMVTRKVHVRAVDAQVRKTRRNQENFMRGGGPWFAVDKKAIYPGLRHSRTTHVPKHGSALQTKAVAICRKLYADCCNALFLNEKIMNYAGL